MTPLEGEGLVRLVRADFDDTSFTVRLVRAYVEEEVRIGHAFESLRFAIRIGRNVHYVLFT